MKARYITASVFIFAIAVVFFVRNKKVREALPEQPDELLTGAYGMAAFIDQVANSVPPEREGTRSQLRGLQALFFVSDYVMIAKTNSGLKLTAPEVIAAYSSASRDLSAIQNRLATYAGRHGTLAGHYRSISENTEAKDHIQQIKAALSESGVTVDTESDLLMDCIRYAAALTEINEMYGPNPRKAQEATPFPAALASMVNASDIVFHRRFVHKHNLDPLLVTNMMKRLGGIRVFGLSPADMEIPARIR